MPDKHYVTIKAAIWKGDKLLIQKEKKLDHGGIVVLDLPGGRIDKGEGIEAGLRREIKEELGVEVDSVSDKPVKAWSALTPDGSAVVALLYEVKLANEDFKLNTVEDEASDILEATYLTAEEFNQAEGEDFTHIPFIKEYFNEQDR